MLGHRVAPALDPTRGWPSLGRLGIGARRGVKRRGNGQRPGIAGLGGRGGQPAVRMAAPGQRSSLFSRALGLGGEWQGHTRGIP